MHDVEDTPISIEKAIKLLGDIDKIQEKRDQQAILMMELRRSILHRAGMLSEAISVSSRVYPSRSQITVKDLWDVHCLVCGRAFVRRKDAPSVQPHIMVMRVIGPDMSAYIHSEACWKTI